MGCSWFLNNARFVMTVEELSTVADGYGGQTETYTTFGAYYVVLQALQGRNDFDFEASEPKVRYKVTSRYTDDLADTATVQKYRFTIDGRNWKPLFVKPLHDDRKTYGKAYLEFVMEDNGAVNG